MQELKEKSVNRINLILNKLSENNLNNLVIEFIKNIRIQTQQDFNEFINTVYNKIINEFKFVLRYLDFFKLISSIYITVFEFDINYLYDIIETKFNNSYINNINDDDEEKRLNNLYLILKLIDYNLLDNKIISHIDEILINQTYCIPDIYYWFKDKKLTNQQENIIKNLIKSKINTREKLLLENLVTVGNKWEINKLVFQEPVIEKPVIKKNTFNIEINNLLEEYYEINNIQEIEYFINNNCTEATMKNKFCEVVLVNYFNSDQDKKISNMFRLLIKSQNLFKSNLSRGLVTIYNKWTQQEHLNYKTKLKSLLLFLRNMGITKGLESIMDKNKIDIII